MRSSPLVLLLLIGVQVVQNMGGGLAQCAGAANHRAGQQQTAAGDHRSEYHSSQERHRTTHHRTKRPHRSPSPAQDRSSVSGLSTPDPFIPVVDPKLFSKRRYRSSPRVVFSEVTPSHDALEDEGYDIEGVRGVRVRRRAGRNTVMHRGEYAVCDSENIWVENLTRATDMYGNEVTVLPNVTINNVVKKQFFYETVCLSPTHRDPPAARGRSGGRPGKQGSKSDNSGCLGIDKRHWNSYCTNSHMFVSALTIHNKRTAWRFIRINAACVCVISRKSWGGRLGR